MSNCSPAINAAIQNSLTPANDLGKNPRNSLSPDVGAVESTKVSCLSTANSTTVEGTTGIVRVSLSGFSGSTVTVNYSTSDGTAVVGNDYAATSGTLTFTFPEISKNIVINTILDNLSEPSETVFITLTSPVNAQITTSQSTLTILNMPIVNFHSSTYSFTEGSNYNIEITLSESFDQVVTVPFTVENINTANSDRTISTSSPISFPVGTTSRTITLTIVDDNIGELNEYFTISIGNPVNAVKGTVTVTNITILENDEPTISFNSTTAQVNEGSTVSLVVLLSNPCSYTVNVDFIASGDNPLYQFITSSPITFDVDSTSQDILVQSVDNNVYNPNSQFNVTITETTKGSISSTNIAMVDIVENDSIPSVSFPLSTYTIKSTINIPVVLSIPSSQLISVPFTVTSVTANNTDYSVNESPILFYPGVTTMNITVTSNSNCFAEAKSFNLNLDNPTNAVTGTIVTTNIIIESEEPQISMETDTRTVNEGSIISIVVTSNIICSSGLDINYTVTGNLNLYQVISQNPIIIPAGSQSQVIQVQSIDNNIHQIDPKFIVTLTSSNHGNVTMETTTVTINDDDIEPFVSLIPMSSVTVFNETHPFPITYNVTLNRPSEYIVTVNIGYFGTANELNYNQSTSTLQFLPMETFQLFDIFVKHNIACENDKTLEVSIVSVMNGTDDSVSSTITIKNNDIAEISFENSNGSVHEGDIVVIPFNASVLCDYNFTVKYEIIGDQSSFSGNTSLPITFSQESIIQFTTIDNNVYESDKHLLIRLTDLENGIFGEISEYSLTIINNDPIPTLYVKLDNDTFEVKENSQFVIQLELSNPSSWNISTQIYHDGNAIIGKDYTLSDLLIQFSPLETVQSLYIDILENDQTDKFILLSFINTENAVTIEKNITLIIVNDDDQDTSILDKRSSESTTNSGMIAGIVIGSLMALLLLFILIALLLKQHKKKEVVPSFSVELVPVNKQ